MVKDGLPAVQDHAKLRAPVADVVVGDDLVPHEAGDAGERVADEGAADVADVHRLGDVWRGEIDDDGLRRIDLRHADVLVLDDHREALGERGGAQREVEKAGAVDAGFVAEVGHVQLVHDLLREGARVCLELFRQNHRRIALVVAVSRVGGDDDIGQKTFRQFDACRSEGGLKTGREDGAKHGRA